MAEFEDLPSEVINEIMEWAVCSTDVELDRATDSESTSWCRLASVCRR